jgi:hypothetical protein
MKKIISIILAITCVFALFSCGSDSGDTLGKINKMYSAIAPTKVVTLSTQTIGNVVLTSTSTLKSGTVDGKIAATYEYKNQELRSLEDGSNETAELPWVEVSGLLEYHEDKGLRENGGKWDDNGENFVPEAGTIKLNLSKKSVKNLKEDSATKTITFTVPAAKSVDVFGEDSGFIADVNVVVTHDGAAITSITLTSSIPSDEDAYPAIDVYINVKYSYDSESITIN